MYVFTSGRSQAGCESRKPVTKWVKHMNWAVNPLMQLRELGQSVWLDELRRKMLRSGELARLIDDDGVGGVTSNPTIFKQAIAEDMSYQSEICRRCAIGGEPKEIYEALVIQDVGDAADLLLRLYRHSEGREGLVSLEVSPLLANDTAATLAEARRLWRAIDRPNAMIKVPATKEGLPAIHRLIAEGINVNATLVFGTTRYREVRDAFVAGLEERRSAGHPLTGISAVASVFVSRIDTLVDERLASVHDAQRARALRGKAGLALARFIYQDFKKFVASPRWQALASHGARPQRLLWASTGTKNPDYSDVKYIDGLIGRDTVTTVPLETLAAYRDHGHPAPRLDGEPYEAAVLPAELLELGIDLESVSRQLETQGVEKFTASFEALLADISGLCGR